MAEDELTSNWQRSIVSDAEKILGRNLTNKELSFIKSRLSYIALEIIEDTVSGLSKTELEDYLNSENGSQDA